MKDLNRVQAGFMAAFGHSFAKHAGFTKSASDGPDMDLMTIMYCKLEEVMEKRAQLLAEGK